MIHFRRCLYFVAQIVYAESANVCAVQGKLKNDASNTATTDDFDIAAEEGGVFQAFIVVLCSHPRLLAKFVQADRKAPPSPLFVGSYS